jgi:hypothetical protein
MFRSDYQALLGRGVANIANPMVSSSNYSQLRE